MLCIPAYVVCVVEPPTGERPRSELIGQSSMTQLGSVGSETSTVAVCTRSVVDRKPVKTD